MIAEFLSWYAQQLRDLLPERFVRRDREAANAILAAPALDEPGALLLTIRRSGEEREAGLHRPGSARLGGLLAENPAMKLLLRLPADAVLSRDVSLPLASEPGFERVLHYEMDRLTPFAAEDIFWSARILRRNKAAGRLDLRLSLVPRAWLASSLQSLQQEGGRPVAIEVPAQGENGIQRIAIAQEPGRERVTQRRLLAAACALCAGLAIIAVVLPFLLQGLASAAIDHRIASLQAPLREVERTRARIRAATAGADIINADRAHLGDELALLAAITRVLPDDTYLTDLTLHDGVLNLTGQSPGAVKLISALSADPAFAAPAFAAPVTRIESNNADLFSIRATVAQN